MLDDLEGLLVDGLVEVLGAGEDDVSGGVERDVVLV